MATIKSSGRLIATTSESDYAEPLLPAHNTYSSALKSAEVIRDRVAPATDSLCVVRIHQDGRVTISDF